MKSKQLLFIFLYFLISQFPHSFVSAQEKKAEGANLPTIGFNYGPSYYYGNVKSTDVKQSFFQRTGKNFFIEQKISHPFSLSYHIFITKLYGDEMIGLNNLNFMSSIFTQSLRFHYNFYPLIRPENHKQKIIPYISVGIESVVFKSFGDLKDGQGRYYHYWNDHTIRDIPQTDSNAAAATIIKRDYVYETNLRDANLDGLGNYPQVAFSIPASAGVNVQLIAGLNVKLSADYHYCFTGLIDNISSAGTGYRKGADLNDRFLFVSLGLNYHFMSKGASTGQAPEIATLNNLPDTNLVKPVSKIPLEFRYADLNKDDVISLDEINKMIELYFEGDKNRTIEGIQRLIEYFFVQK